MDLRGDEEIFSHDGRKHEVANVTFDPVNAIEFNEKFK